MAKGNLLQGMARGKVGDLVFSRMDGEQITRVRNRRPRNPKTNKQLYQRAIMATVSQLYAAGQEIFNHSFEGATTPADNQRRFMSENVKILRSLLANDLNTHAADDACQARFAAPGVLSPVPSVGLMVSDGSLTENLSILREGRLHFDLDSTDYPTYGDLIAKKGWVSTDLFTIIGFWAYLPKNDVPAGYENDWPQTVFNMRFYYCQLGLKPEIFENQSQAYDNELAEIFYVKAATNLTLSQQRLNGFNGDSNLDWFIFFQPSHSGDIQLGANAVIRSREDSPLRSRSYIPMQFADYGKFGLTSNHVLDAWKRGAVEVGDSDYILEGGDSQPITPTPAPTPTPPVSLVDSGLYAINIPLELNGQMATTPIFVTYIDPSGNIICNLIANGEPGSDYTVYNVEDSFDNISSIDFDENGFQETVNIWGSNVIGMLKTWYPNIAFEGFESFIPPSSVLFVF